VLFALYHGDPLHVLSVLPLGLALGWLRMVSRSIWPSIAVHFGNNVIAVLWTLQSGGDADQEVSVGLGAACALVSITCLGSLRLFQSPRRDARE
jgi:membrane protease YdiL (CAAX protease family)